MFKNEIIAMLILFNCLGIIYLIGSERQNVLENQILSQQIQIQMLIERAYKLDFKQKAKGMLFEATAYCDEGLTATGTKARKGVVAVDPKVIPLGSMVNIEGLGTFIAEDTGGVVKGNIVDIWMPTEEECLNWGRRKVTVEKISRSV